MLAIPSPTGAEMDLIRWLKEGLQGQGFTCELQPVDDKRSNLVALRGEARFLIATHADTVPGWGHPEAERPRIANDRIYGRGALDTKGQLAALLWAMEKAEAPAAVAVFVDEERDGRGSERFTPPRTFAGAVVLEPTGLALAISESGSLELKLTVTGEAAHGAMPNAGANAIERFFQVYQGLKGLPFMRAREPGRAPAAITLGRLEGGIDPQVVPERCVAQFDLIIPSHLDFERTCTTILEFLEKHEWLRYEVLDREPPWETSPQEEVARALASALRKITGEEPRYTEMPAWTDAANLVKKSIPAVVFGAGELALAHTPREHASLEGLLLLGRILQEFLVAAAPESP